MLLDISKRQAAQVLAALRHWQDQARQFDIADYFEGYFEEHDPLSSDEIDALCSRIAETSAKSKE
jgi:hypothetical protein